MVTLPDGYVPVFPDSEALVLDMVQPQLDRLDPTGLGYTWFPDKKDRDPLLGSGVALVRVHKMPGVLAAEDRILLSNVQIACLTSKRSDSWDVLNFVVDELYRTYQKGGQVQREDGSFTHVRSFDVAPNTQQIPDLNPDHRVVQTLVTVGVRRRL